MALGALKPWEKNPRKITPSQARRLLSSWAELGQFQTIAIGPEHEVYDGHQRLSALRRVHGPDYCVDVRQASRALSDDERRKLVIMAHAGAVGAWDWDKLEGWEKESLQEWGLDKDTLGMLSFDAVRLREILQESASLSVDAEPHLDNVLPWRIS